MPRRSCAFLVALVLAASATSGDAVPKPPRGIHGGFRPIWEAAHRGEPEAMFKLGRALVYGTTPGPIRGALTQGRIEGSYHGLKKDKRRGYEWIRKAVDAGSPVAAYWLADQPEEGTFDPVKTRQLMEKAAVGGYEHARKWLLTHGYTEGMIAKLGAPSREDRVGSLRTQAAAGDPKATLELARAYEKGDGVSADAAEADRWYRAAAALDHGEGHAYLARQAEAAGDHEAAIGHWVRARMANTYVYIGGAQKEIDRIRAAHPKLHTPGTGLPWWSRTAYQRPLPQAGPSAMEAAMDRVTAWQAAREARIQDSRRDFNAYQRQTGGQYRYTDGQGKELR